MLGQLMKSSASIITMKSKVKVNALNNIFLFGSIPSPLCVHQKTLRSQSQYLSDCSMDLVWSCLFEIRKILGSNMYLITGSRAAPVDRIRSKKGLLWNQSELTKLENRKGEVALDDGTSRLWSLVALNNAARLSYSPSWLTDLLIFSNLEIDTLSEALVSWLSAKKSSPLAFDFESISKTLLLLDNCVVCRYFFPDNGRPEMLFLVSRTKSQIDSVVAGI
jgi:hypothetical protein